MLKKMTRGEKDEHRQRDKKVGVELT